MNLKEMMMSLLLKHPTVAMQWDYEKNHPITPSIVMPFSTKKVGWICEKGHRWDAVIYSRTRGGNGCPYCSGHRVSHENCLRTVCPTIADQWDVEKNHSLTPEIVHWSSNKKVGWICQRGHRWDAAINTRTSGGNGCPYCRGFYVTPQNSLEGRNPEAAAQWDWAKNHPHTPSTVTFSTHKRFGWICAKGHKWEASANSRSIHGCVSCKESKGEKFIDLHLQKLNLKFCREVSPATLKHIGRLRIDFVVALPPGDHGFAIEYHGIQHYEPIDTFGGQKALEENQERDQLKRVWCEKKGIPLLEVKYTDIERVPQIIDQFILSLVVLDNTW